MGAHRDVCGFFSTPDDEYKAVLPFIKEGALSAAERAFHVVDPELLRETHLRRLAALEF